MKYLFLLFALTINSVVLADDLSVCKEGLQKLKTDNIAGIGQEAADLVFNGLENKCEEIMHFCKTGFAENLEYENNYGMILNKRKKENKTETSFTITPSECSKYMGVTFSGPVKSSKTIETINEKTREKCSYAESTKFSSEAFMTWNASNSEFCFHKQFDQQNKVFCKKNPFLGNVRIEIINHNILLFQIEDGFMLNALGYDDPISNEIIIKVCEYQDDKNLHFYEGQSKNKDLSSHDILYLGEEGFFQYINNLIRKADLELVSTGTKKSIYNGKSRDGYYYSITNYPSIASRIFFNPDTNDFIAANPLIKIKLNRKMNDYTYDVDINSSIGFIYRKPKITASGFISFENNFKSHKVLTKE